MIVIDSSKSLFLNTDSNINNTIVGLIEREVKEKKNIVVIETKEELLSFVERTSYNLKNLPYQEYYDKKLLEELMKDEVIVKYGTTPLEDETKTLTNINLDSILALPLRYFPYYNFKLNMHTSENGFKLFTLSHPIGDFYFMNGFWFRLNNPIEGFRIIKSIDIENILFLDDENVSAEDITSFYKFLTSFETIPTHKNLPEKLCSYLKEEYDDYFHATDILTNVVMEVS